MTKKSYSRVQRDLAESNTKKDMDNLRKNTKTWDDLIGIHAEMAAMLFSIPAQIQRLYSIEKIENFLLNKTLTHSLIVCLSSDLRAMNEDLVKIYESHKDKTGCCETDDDFISSLTIVEAYNAFHVKFEGVIMPTVNTLGLHFDEAMKKVNEIVEEEKAKTSLVDPTVVSDAVVKE